MGEKPTAEEDLETSPRDAGSGMATGRDRGLGSASERVSMQDLGGDSIAAGPFGGPAAASNLNTSKSNINRESGGNEGAAERRVVGPATETGGPARPDGGPASPGGSGPATPGGGP